MEWYGGIAVSEPKDLFADRSLGVKRTVDELEVATLRQESSGAAPRCTPEAM